MIKKIATNTAYLFSSSIINRILSTITGLVTAKVLGPNDFGLLRLINYIPSLSKFGSLGLSAVAKREIPHIRGRKEGYKKESKIKNVSFSAEIIWGLILSLVIIVVSFFFENYIVKYGLLVTSITLFFGCIRRIYFVILTVDKRFKDIAYVQVISGFILSLIVLSTVYWGKIFSVLFGGLVATLISLIVLARTVKLDFNFSLNSQELSRQLKIGIPLAGGTFAYGVFGWTERSFIIGLFGSEILGYYMFFIFLIEGVTIFLKNFLRSITVDLYENLGKDTLDRKTKNMVIKPSLLIALLFPFIGGLVWILGIPIIANYLQSYSEVSSIIMFIVPLMTFESVSSLARTSMNSARLNMQVHFMILFFVASFIFGLGVYIFRDYNNQLLLVAVVRIVSSLSIFLGGFFLIKKYFFNSRVEFIKTLFMLLFPMCYVFFIIHTIKLFIHSDTLLQNLYQLILYVLIMVPIFILYWRMLKLTKLIKKIMMKEK